MAVDGAAHALGLAPGMALADARARCPALMTLPVDPEADARELARLISAMARFTPMVSADPPNGIILDITGCAHLFGGEAGLVRQAVALAAYTCRPALADNAAAARALARHGGRNTNVRVLPVAALDLPDEALAALRRAGLHTIGDLARRPMQPLAARFGAETVLKLRHILGEVASPIAPHRTLPPNRLEARLTEPVIRTEDALEVIEDLLVQAAREMEARKLGGRRFVATFCRSDNARRRLMVETGHPVRDPAIVLRLLRERIETLADPLDPGFGFDTIGLTIPRAEPLPSRQIGLGDEQEEGADSLAALIDRLGVRLGTDRVRRIVPCDRHLPERAQALEPAMSTQTGIWPVAEHPPRPPMMFDPPQPIEVIAEVPDGPPHRFRWRCKLHEVRLYEGPERIAAEWWRRKGGEGARKAGLTRDYYRIEDACGRRYWIFRHGLYDETPQPRWYLHGLFA
ncbi:MAG TPA: DNA polymerase Y family protein [Novosphingobium sp.]|nr:DNA polymerase Y family protein [Novosphingobium sp.]